MQHDQINEDGGRKHSLPAIQTYANVNPHTNTHVSNLYRLRQQSQRPLSVSMEKAAWNTGNVKRVPNACRNLIQSVKVPKQQ